MFKVKCQTPREYCSGGLESTSKGVSPATQNLKVHGDHEEAIGCYSRYLVRQLGHRRLDRRTFAPADGGPVVVLTKPCRYGARMRRGKEGNRVMPKGATRKNTRAGQFVG